MKEGWAFDIVVLAASLALFGFLSLRQLELPGLYYDEAADAVPAMQLALGQKVELFNQTGLLIAGKDLPVMTMDYVGTVNTYLLVPFFALLGVNVFSLRLLTVAGSGLTIIFSYFLSKDLFDRPTAAITALLLAVSPSFIFWSRQGIHVTSIMTVMSTGSLLCLLRWRGRRSPVFLYLAAFLLGLGLSAKLLFLWFILALLGCGVLLVAIPGIKSSLPVARRVNWRVAPLHALICLLSFLIGGWMILVYNVLTEGTLKYLSKNLVTTSYGVNNFAFLDNLLTTLDRFKLFLQGDNFWYLGGLFANDWYPVAFTIAAIGTLLILVHPEARRRWRYFLFPLLMTAFIIVQSCFTVSDLWATHFFITYPFPQLIVAVFAVAVVRLAPLKRIAIGAAFVAVALLVAKDIYVDSEYHRVLAKTGGLYTHSDAIYRLAQYLDQRGVAEPIAMDWGIKTSTQILTQGRINPVEIFQYGKDPSPVFFDWLYGALTTRPNTIYIFHAEGSEVFPRYEAFLTLAQKLDKKVGLEQTIRREDGAPLYTIYSAR